jgi:hypothetical protein
VLLTLLGCSATTAPKAGQDLSTAGVTTANALARFYDKLADDCIDISELDAMVLTMDLGSGADVRAEIDQTTNDYERYAGALRARAAAARQLASLYTALGNLSSSGITSRTGDAAAELSATVADLPAFKGQIDFDPAPLTKLIAEDLMSLKQAADIRAASGTAGQALLRIADLFDSERGVLVVSATAQPTTRPAATTAAITRSSRSRLVATSDAAKNNVYRSVITRRSELAGQLASRLIDRGYVDPSGVMKQLAETYGIPWDGRIKPDDSATLAAAADVQAFELARQGELAAAAAVDLSAALRALANQHARFQQTGAFDPSQAQALAERAQAYIDEVENIRKQIKAAHQQQKADGGTGGSTTAPSHHSSG